MKNMKCRILLKYKNARQIWNQKGNTNMKSKRHDKYEIKKARQIWNVEYSWNIKKARQIRNNKRQDKYEMQAAREHIGSCAALHVIRGRPPPTNHPTHPAVQNYPLLPKYKNSPNTIVNEKSASSTIHIIAAIIPKLSKSICSCPNKNTNTHKYRYLLIQTQNAQY